MTQIEPKLIVVKNMVCPRCIRAVQRIFESEGLKPLDVQLGEVRVERLDVWTRNALGAKLRAEGFDLVENSTARLIARAKALIVARIHHAADDDAMKLSSYLSDRLHHDYSYLSRVFSAVEGVTIERFATKQRVERVKELLAYGELSIAGIAAETGYSSPAHLSSQFKRETGLTPRDFRQARQPDRRNLDAI